MSSPIKVFIVEDNKFFREGLVSLIRHAPGLDFTGCSASGTEALATIPVDMPDVILMDIDLPGINGLECTQQIKSAKATAQVQVIMLTILEDEYRVLEAILAGASGYLLKSSSPQAITDAINQVVAGGSPMSPAIARKVFGLVKYNFPAPTQKIELNRRETEVLEGLVEGLTYKMIGEKYFIAVDTVRTYIRTIYEKLQVHSRSEAIVKAIKQKLV